jgi:hypothetical protein
LLFLFSVDKKKIQKIQNSIFDKKNFIYLNLNIFGKSAKKASTENENKNNNKRSNRKMPTTKFYNSSSSK